MQNFLKEYFREVLCKCQIKFEMLKVTCRNEKLRNKNVVLGEELHTEFTSVKKEEFQRSFSRGQSVR